MGIRHVGESASALLADGFESIERLAKTGAEELADVEGIGPILAESAVAFFANPENREELARLGVAGLPTELTETERSEIAARGTAASDGSNPVAGKRFVLTGTLPTLKRSEAKKRILERGGKVPGSVSANVDYVVAGEKAGSKRTKAESLGIPVIDEEELLRMLDGESETD